jgi:hypothetical protein
MIHYPRWNAHQRQDLLLLHDGITRFNRKDTCMPYAGLPVKRVAHVMNTPSTPLLLCGYPCLDHADRLKTGTCYNLFTTHENYLLFIPALISTSLSL